MFVAPSHSRRVGRGPSGWKRGSAPRSPSCGGPAPVAAAPGPARQQNHLPPVDTYREGSIKKTF
jgi:hypothetical protein